jgi:predicted secreted protein
MTDMRIAGSRKIAVLAHCMLNQNTKPDRRARFRGVVQPVLEVFAQEGLAIFQLPCPEIGFAGPWRFSQVIQQYDTPQYRTHRRSLVVATVDQLEHCLRPADDGHDYQIAIVGVEGSPSCGITKVGWSREWRGFPGSVRFDGRYPVGDGAGIFMQELRREIERRRLPLPPMFGLGLDIPDLDVKTLAGEFRSRLRAVFGEPVR